MSEPFIQIGDRVLTEAQAMAVRVAVTIFFCETGSKVSREELGEISDSYHERLGEVIKAMFRSTCEQPQ